MIYNVSFNKGKNQRKHYYWISRKAIAAGEFKRIFAAEFKNGSIDKITEFKDYLIITCNRRIAADNACNVIELDKPKGRYTYFEVKEVIDSGKIRGDT